MNNNPKSKKELKLDLFIFGTGVFAEIAYSYFKRYTNYRIVGFISDNKQYKKKFLGLDVLKIENVDKNLNPKYCHIFVAVGYNKMNKVREKYFKIFKKKNYKLATFIHPNVVTWDDQTIGENCFIFENNVIQKRITLKNNIIIWSGNHIGHDSIINENTWITSKSVIYSNVTVGKNCFIGSSSNIKENVELGNFNFVGAGTNIWNSSIQYSFFPPKKTDPIKLDKKDIENLI